MEWQPIETAPLEMKEQVLILDSEGNVRLGRWYDRSYMGGKCHVRCISDFDFGDFLSTCFWPNDLQPTHWMPLPEPPKGF